jgi:GTP cyclohydrolase I
MGAADRRAAAVAIDAFLRALGRDPEAEPELLGTGDRVAAAYLDELCDGYDVDVAALVRDGAIGGKTERVALHDIALTTMCPHHLMPASGMASVAFAPYERIVGLGSIVKLVDAFAHRLVLQESIGENVVLALTFHLGVRWAACRIVMSHTCVTARGERRHAARAETVAFAGEEAERSTALASLGARA